MWYLFQAVIILAAGYFWAGLAAEDPPIGGGAVAIYTILTAYVATKAVNGLIWCWRKLSALFRTDYTEDTARSGPVVVGPAHGEQIEQRPRRVLIGEDSVKLPLRGPER